MSDTASCLGDLLAPYPEADFLRDDWHKAFRHVEGAPGRFASLMSWRDLNRILSTHELDTPRLALLKSGADVGDPPYLRYGHLRDAGRTAVPRIDAEALSHHLRDGATLVLNRVDALHPPVAALARGLERRFGAAIHVNLYAGWRTTEGLNLHWDDHDVLVLQVHGRKHWRLYGQTRAHPVPGDVGRDIERPESVLWDAFLEAGDLLYIPRGWWHMALPLDEPTLHLTIGIAARTGEDLIRWMIRKLRESETARMDLPRIADGETRRRHLRDLRQAFDALWHDDLIDDFFRFEDQNAVRRTDPSLPFAAFDQPFANRRAGVFVEWRTARDAALSTEPDGRLQLRAHGKSWTFAAAAAPILRRLMDGGRYEVAALCAELAGSVSADQIAELLGGLLHDGLVVASDEEAGWLYGGPT